MLKNNCLDDRLAFIGAYRYGQAGASPQQFPFPVGNIGNDGGTRPAVVVVIYRSLYRDCRDGFGRHTMGSRQTRYIPRGKTLDIGMYEQTILRNMKVIVLIQPDMPVNAGSFIIPAFILGSIHTDGHHIFLSVPDISGDVTGKAAITAGIGAAIKTVDPDFAVPIDAIELNDKTLPRIRGRY